MARPADPPTADRFTVEAAGLEPTGFSEVRGLEATAERRDVPLADLVPDWVASLVGDGTVNRLVPVSPTLVLVRAADSDGTLRAWFDGYIDGSVGARTVLVSLLDADGEAVARWKCENAVPERWVGPHLRTDRSTVAVESLELAHDGVKRA
ncbi:phage tail protein [Halosegnis marinus]|uniref:Phage tail protein n=1 Tax=Halosegnis marinus TaxID=3034023 RepID=A0ABD5ZNE7_9EURY|nr:phage tail protein [Halosegnis sp. DT85]